MIDCESAVVAGLMDVLNRGSYLHTRISQDGVLAHCPGGIQVLGRMANECFLFKL